MKRGSSDRWNFNFVRCPLQIGVFDSGLGGLSVMQGISDLLPDHDLLYLGDTKRVPYGNRSQTTIHEFVAEALTYLFAQDCLLVILACNTASAESLRKTQQEYLPVFRPDHRVLGVIIPTVEAVFESFQPQRVGVLATASTVQTGAYERELKFRHPAIEVVSKAAPLLVPMIEGDGIRYIRPVLQDYLKELGPVDSVVLGCTHYSLIAEEVRQLTEAQVVSPNEVVPHKLVDYLARHPEIDSRLSKTGARRYEVTDLGPGYEALVAKMAGKPLDLEEVVI
jgi:glutamate racemase